MTALLVAALLTLPMLVGLLVIRLGFRILDEVKTLLVS